MENYLKKHIKSLYFFSLTITLLCLSNAKAETIYVDNGSVYIGKEITLICYEPN